MATVANGAQPPAKSLQASVAAAPKIEPPDTAPKLEPPSTTPKTEPPSAAPPQPAYLAPHSAAALPPPKPTLRLPAFLALGLGGLSAGGAVVTGIIGSGQRYDPKYDCARCMADQRLSLATKILAGAAAVGVGTGVVLLLTGSRKERPSLTPSLGVHLSGTQATAKALWKF